MAAYDMTLGRIQFHMALAEGKLRTNYRLGQIMRWGIPIISAILTAFASGELGSRLQGLTVLLGFLITLLTTVNSVGRFMEEYAFAANFSNKFRGLYHDLSRNWEYIDKAGGSNSDKEKARYDLLARTDKELERVVKEFNKRPIQDEEAKLDDNASKHSSHGQVTGKSG